MSLRLCSRRSCSPGSPTRSSRAWLGAHGSPATPPAALIIRRGDAGDSFFVVAGGRVQAALPGLGGSRAVDFVSRYDFFGELALLDRDPRSADVVALDPPVWSSSTARTSCGSSSSTRASRTASSRCFASGCTTTPSAWQTLPPRMSRRGLRTRSSVLPGASERRGRVVEVLAVALQGARVVRQRPGGARPWWRPAGRGCTHKPQRSRRLPPPAPKRRSSTPRRGGTTGVSWS